ncbi:gp4 [Enterobacteria phage ES18]|uniref:gp4 n=1 Tax=Enterobacteria phage ES18 TaxID=101570 RepID=UPI00004C9809|nr:gp4 [Enterobacteria phage ES18]AAW70475.1 gp4 [Enterobacteria phage ES18]
MTEYWCSACGKIIRFDYVSLLYYNPRHCRALTLRKVESFNPAKGPKIPPMKR